MDLWGAGHGEGVSSWNLHCEGVEKFSADTKQPKVPQFWGLSGGPWRGLDGPSSYYLGLYGCSSTRIVTKSYPNPIPGVAEGLRKKPNWKSGDTKQPEKPRSLGFWRAPGPG